MLVPRTNAKGRPGKGADKLQCLVIVVDRHIDEHIKGLPDKVLHDRAAGHHRNFGEFGCGDQIKRYRDRFGFAFEKTQDFYPVPVFTQGLCKCNDLIAITGVAGIDKNAKMILTVFLKLGGTLT